MNIPRMRVLLDTATALHSTITRYEGMVLNTNGYISPAGITALRRNLTNARAQLKAVKAEFTELLK